ncbi:hypothetical protein IU459_16115 [Nocardia amamiensis]|uniref:Transposase n=1 Tax=Nocardia amamiensis TaxID=404578 RepID=A0ABS0CR89_9NOCA|nr:hypothetical protein [Nocardia amamiensis]MBF6299055.1 hypothetical protein [Nocardia amamiensis]
MDRPMNHRVVLNQLQPKVPEGDDLETASDIVNFVLRRALRLSRDIQRYAGQRQELAPASSRLALAFAGIIAAEAIAWVRRWPK